MNAREPGALARFQRQLMLLSLAFADADDASLLAPLQDGLLPAERRGGVVERLMASTPGVSLARGQTRPRISFNAPFSFCPEAR